MPIILLGVIFLPIITIITGIIARVKEIMTEPVAESIYFSATIISALYSTFIAARTRAYSRSCLCILAFMRLKNTAPRSREPMPFVIASTANGDTLPGIFFISTISADQAMVTLIRIIVYCILFIQLSFKRTHRRRSRK